MNIFAFRKILGDHPPYALYFNGILDMMRFQLAITLKHRYNHPWANKDTIPELERFIELLDNRNKKDYFERCAGVSYEDYYMRNGNTEEFKKFNHQAYLLQEKEAEELSDLFKKGIMNKLDRVS